MTTNALTKVSSVYSKILNYFPVENILFCFAYGSGVFQQANTKSKTENMLDFIFTVNNAQDFHEKNLKLNGSHYSGTKFVGSSIISKLQTQIPSHLYFNSMIPLEIDGENVVIKYGVISQDDAIRDLLDWTDLYYAGRLHKPVQIVKQAKSGSMKTALQLNLITAIHAALLLLPEHFTEAQFYKTVTGLSYTGDFRMTFGEDVNKIENIVNPQIEQFRELYTPVLKSFADYVDIPKCDREEREKHCSQDVRYGLEDCHSEVPFILCF